MDSNFKVQLGQWISSKIPTKTSDLTNDSNFVHHTPTPATQNIHDIIDIIYPVGSIYMNVNDTNPSLLFGGTWEKIEDRFLLASGENHLCGGTGGHETVTLTTTQMPSHTHVQNSHTHTQAGHSHKPSSTSLNFMISDANIAINGTKRVFTSSTNGSYYFVYASETGNGINEVNNTNSVTPTINGQTATNQNTGGGQAHDNMPPYLTVGIWQRTA